MYYASDGIRGNNNMCGKNYVSEGICGNSHLTVIEREYYIKGGLVVCYEEFEWWSGCLVFLFSFSFVSASSIRYLYAFVFIKVFTKFVFLEGPAWLNGKLACRGV